MGGVGGALTSAFGLQCRHEFHKFCRAVYTCLNQQKTAILSDFHQNSVTRTLKCLQLVLCCHDEKTSMHLGRKVQKALKMHHTLLISVADIRIAASLSLKLYFCLRLSSELTDVVCNLCRVWLMRTVRSGRR